MAGFSASLVACAKPLRLSNAPTCAGAEPPAPCHVLADERLQPRSPSRVAAAADRSPAQRAQQRRHAQRLGRSGGRRSCGAPAAREHLQQRRRTEAEVRKGGRCLWRRRERSQRTSLWEWGLKPAQSAQYLQVCVGLNRAATQPPLFTTQSSQGPESARATAARGILLGCHTIMARMQGLEVMMAVLINKHAPQGELLRPARVPPL